jgi:hypothetical protein
MTVTVRYQPYPQCPGMAQTAPKTAAQDDCSRRLCDIGEQRPQSLIQRRQGLRLQDQ